jgi:hypothetical protein
MRLCQTGANWLLAPEGKFRPTTSVHAALHLVSDYLQLSDTVAWLASSA